MTGETGRIRIFRPPVRSPDADQPFTVLSTARMWGSMSRRGGMSSSCGWVTPEPDA
jgi:hypothetical protein